MDDLKNKLKKLKSVKEQINLISNEIKEVEFEALLDNDIKFKVQEICSALEDLGNTLDSNINNLDKLMEQERRLDALRKQVGL